MHCQDVTYTKVLCYMFSLFQGKALKAFRYSRMQDAPECTEIVCAVVCTSNMHKVNYVFLLFFLYWAWLYIYIYIYTSLCIICTPFYRSNMWEIYFSVYNLHPISQPQVPFMHGQTQMSLHTH